MLGSKKKIEELQQQVTDLEQTLSEAVALLRRQVAGLSTGIPVAVESIVEGLPFSTVPVEEVDITIDRIPNLIALDVRTDGPWDAGHIATAKHIPSNQLMARLHEMPDRMRPILIISDTGAEGVPCCKLLAREGYAFVFNAAGGMQAYTGDVVASEILPTNIDDVQGVDRELIKKVAALIDSDVRPGLQRDGGDLELVAVEAGTVKVRMVGACMGCGAQSMTVQQGIKTYLTHTFPEITDVEDLTGA